MDEKRVTVNVFWVLVWIAFAVVSIPVSSWDIGTGMVLWVILVVIAVIAVRRVWRRIRS